MLNRSRTISESGAFTIMVQLINKIAQDKSFCVSSQKKVPLNVLDYITTLDERDIRPVTGEDLKNQHLATLNQINDCPSFKYTNRAYYLHAAENLIIGFDIEPRCWVNYLAYFAKLPAHYREYSMHNGIHLLYQLDRQKLIPSANEMIAERTEYKFKQKVNGQPLEYEMMLNHHWLTLTRRTFGKQDDLNTPVPDVIYQLINQVSLEWAKNKREIKDVALDKNASELAKKIANMIEPSKLEPLSQLTVGDYNDDDSLYEYMVALKLAGMIYYRLYEKPKPFDSMYLGTDPKLISETDYIWATALLLEKLVTPRDKDAEMRDGLPWLVYNAKTACLYVLANNNGAVINDDESDTNDQNNQ